MERLYLKSANILKLTSPLCRTHMKYWELVRDAWIVTHIRKCIVTYLETNSSSFFFLIFIQNVTRPSDFLKEEGFNLTAFQLKQLWNILQKGFRNIFKKTIVHDSFLFLLLLFVFFPSLSGIYWSPDISPEILNLRNSVRGVTISILFLTTTQTRESFRYHSLLQHLPGWLLSIQWNPFDSLSLILILFKPESCIVPPQC